MSHEYVDFEKTGKYHYVKVVQDDACPEDPRVDWENFGIMACKNMRRHNLGDKDHRFDDVSDFLRKLANEIDPTADDRIDYWEYGDGWLALKDHAKVAERVKKIIEDAIAKAVILPLYIYDHSGVTMSVAPFSCPWDSGQVGYIYATPDMIRREYNCKNITKRVRNKVEKLLKSEVETYAQWLTGDIWCICVEDMYGEVVDSCCGYYGNDYAKKEAKASLKAADKHGRPKCTHSTFQAMRRHEADLRRMYKMTFKNEENPIKLADILERAAKLQKDRMKMREDFLTDHFSEE